MRGFVPTPDTIVDLMVEKLFANRPPTAKDMLLDPGCGPGAFIAGVIRWTEKHRQVLPTIIGYESEPGRCAQAAEHFKDFKNVTILCKDFLTAIGEFDYIIGNPPYVPITELSTVEKREFRRRFASAEGRFDLYLLFFEQALRLLSLRGRLVFVTPEKFLYVNTARSFRQILANYDIREIEFLNEETFGDLVTYPTVTTVDSSCEAEANTTIRTRDGSQRTLRFPKDGASLQPLIHEYISSSEPTTLTLGDVSARISCGIATGADSVFVKKTNELDPKLRSFSFPTIAGRELVQNGDAPISRQSMLIPYDRDGKLLPFSRLGALGSYLSRPTVKQKLEARTCVDRKPWYAFHDSVPLRDIARPKLVCKDITASPHFWIDRDGIVPRHTVYYIVLRNSSKLEELRDFLNGPEASAWLRSHCQRASKGFLRLQSSILKKLPIPARFAHQDDSKVRNGDHVAAQAA